MYYIELNNELLLLLLNMVLNTLINATMALFNQQDQFENIASHTHKGVDFLDKYGNFVRDRCAIEVEYAAKLR